MDFIEDLDVYNIIRSLAVKFDCVIMNPPYQRNLHLKVLAEAVKHLKDDGVCVNLSPVRWLQDPFAKYKKQCDLKRFEKSVVKHIEELEVIEALDAQKLFTGAGAATALAIYKCDLKTHSIEMPIPTFVMKVIEKRTSTVKFDLNKNDGYRVRLPIISSISAGHTDTLQLEGLGKIWWFLDGKKADKWWHECYQKNQHTKATPEIPCSIKFNTQLEAENFCKQYDTVFCRVFTHFVKRDVQVNPKLILWMGDAVNPRTGLKGYLGEWTDEDFYRYFELTDDEVKIVEDTMKKYAAK